MTRKCVRTIFVAVCAVGIAFSVFASETYLLKAGVRDIEGRPMEGAKLFLYDTPNVRRPADFISPLSSRAGQLQINVPPGKYWAVARFKADGKYGPLLPGDKHSGEPLEVDMTSGAVEADFVVADIRELGQKKRASATDAVRLKGRVVDEKGAAVAHAFVYGNRSKDFSELPEYLSAWTGDDGVYELYVPPGTAYFVGASRSFPLKETSSSPRQLVVEPGKIDIAIDINLAVQ